jgi:Zn finger protein HypA/HybF involved in hydrogenase expression
VYYLDKRKTMIEVFGIGWFLGVLFGWFIPLIACIIVGKEKNRNGFLWGLFFGIIGLIVVAILPPLSPKIKKKVNSSVYYEKNPGEDKCPNCNGFYDPAFKVCPHCGYDITKKYEKIEREPTIRVKENQSTIICQNCSHEFIEGISPENLGIVICPYCKKKINSKNVVFK